MGEQRAERPMTRTVSTKAIGPAAVIGIAAVAAGAAWLYFQRTGPAVDERTRERLAPRRPSAWRGTDANPSS